MAVQSEITRIKAIISDSYAAVGEKNGSLPGIQNSGNLPAAIRSITSAQVIKAPDKATMLSQSAADPGNIYYTEAQT